MHLAGSRGLDVFAPLLERRTGVRVGALHPLQTFPSTTVGLERLAGAWAAVAGDPAVADIARSLGLRPFELADADRGRYHAAAVVASNHLVALLGQVERLAATSSASVRGVRPARAGLGAERVRARSRGRAHRTGRRAATSRPSNNTCAISTRPNATPTARSHAEAARLTGRRDTGLDRLLGDLRQQPGTTGDE